MNQKKQMQFSDLKLRMYGSIKLKMRYGEEEHEMRFEGDQVWKDGEASNLSKETLEMLEQNYPQDPASDQMFEFVAFDVPELADTGNEIVETCRFLLGIIQ